MQDGWNSCRNLILTLLTDLVTNISTQMLFQRFHVGSVGEAHVTEVEESTPITAVVATIAESHLISGLTLQELQDAQLGDINIG